MRKCFLVITILMFVCTGCGIDDTIWDFANYGVEFTIVDEHGNDLLDDETEGNILGNDISVEYKGKVYKKESRLKENAPRPFSLRTEYKESINLDVISFGEFSPTKNYKGESFVIYWGDGTKDIIKLDLYITWKRGKPTVHKAIYLNDKLYSKDSFLIKITKK